MSFPDKGKRERCWSSRDKYWKCLDTNEDDQSKCMDELKSFENECPSLWVKHFHRKREYLKFKAKLDSENDELQSTK